MNDVRSIRFSETKEIISLYIDTTKTLLSLSTGALALTIILRKEIVGAAAGSPIGNMMLAAWMFYLLTILFSALYQYFGVKYLETFSIDPGEIGKFKNLVHESGRPYGAILVTFCIGSIFLVCSAYQSAI